MRNLAGRLFGRRTGMRVAVTAAVVVLTTTTMATAAVASPRPHGRSAAQPAAATRAGDGTVAAKGAAGHQGSTRFIAHKAVPQDSSGDLSTVLTEDVNGGYTAAGAAMRNLGYGTITITGVPSGATVVNATLLWDVLDNSPSAADGEGTFDGTPVTGTLWASGDSPCWPVSSNFSYEADVTSLVSGNGAYSLSGFSSGDTNGQDPWLVGSDPPLLEGASLVVTYQLASMPETIVQIGEGATETDSGNSATATMDGFSATSPVSAQTTYIVADGQEAGNEAEFNDNLLGFGFQGSDPLAVGSYSQGDLWDTITTDVSSLMNPGDGSASMSVTGEDDCLVYVGQVLAVQSAPCMTSLTFGAYQATAEGGSCFEEQSDDTYTDSGPVSLNGLLLTPQSGNVTINTDPGQVYADDASVQIGPYTVYTGTIPTTDLTGSFSIPISSAAGFAGLTLPDTSLEVESSADEGLAVTGKITLPDDLGGFGVELQVTLTAADGLTGATLSADNLDIPIGNLKVGLDGLSLGYNWETNTWTGGVTVGLPTPSDTKVAGMITITDGSVTQFAVNVSDINEPLGPDGVFLQSIGANVVISPPPASITGSAGITAGPEIDGASAISVDGSLGYTFSNPGDFKMTGSLTLLNGTSFSQTLASGELDYYTNGNITASGQAAFSLFSVVTLHGELSGWVQGSSAFSLTGSAGVKVGLWNFSGAEGVVSSVGIGACGQPFGDLGPSVGFGYKWGGKLDVMSDSCDLGPYSAAEPDASANDDAAIRVRIPAGLPVASFEITGANATAPTGTLVTPSGHKLTVNPADQGVFKSSSPEYGLGVDASTGVDYVVVDAPAGGTWTFEPAAGSATKSMASADGLTAPKISAKVTGSGLHRELSWKIKHLDGQKVTFVEQAASVNHVITANVTKASGRVAFTPADGPAGKRAIVAVVTENGLTSGTVKVASYRAPATSSLILTVAKSAAGKGTIKITPAGGTCKTTCTLAELTGKKVTLTPVASAGSTFSWTNGICTGTGACTIKLTELIALTGTFTG